MSDRIKNLIKKTPLYPHLRVLAVKRAQRGAVERWEEQGRPSPPPHVIKQQVLRELAAAYGTQYLVETGTYYGDMIAAMMPHFAHVYSIELSPDLAEKARRRFRRSRKVTIVHGDSAKALDDVIAELDGPALFWLDGHYSGGETACGEKETPVLDELAQIFSAGRDDVIVIDDARLFGTDPGYPTIGDVRSFVLQHRPEATIEVELDSIRILPRRP